MTLTYNDVLIVTGESRTDAVGTGLVPSGEQLIEVLEFLRAEWAVPVARGNRVIKLPVMVQLPPCADFGTAMVQALTFFANLPDPGPLVIEDGSYRVTFNDAVCVNFKQVDEVLGKSNAILLNFVLSEPTHVTLSTLAQMDSRYIGNMPAITGLTGGGASNLDGYTTTDVSVGFVLYITATIGAIVQPRFMRLMTDPAPGVTVTNTNPSAGALIVLPADYNSSSNAKIWTEQ